MFYKLISPYIVYKYLMSRLILTDSLTRKAN